MITLFTFAFDRVHLASNFFSFASNEQRHEPGRGEA